MSSAAAPADSAGFLASLPFGVLTFVLVPFLDTHDLLAISSSSRDARRVLLSPALWLHRVFQYFPPIPSSSSSSSSSLSSWCEAMQW